MIAHSFNSVLKRNFKLIINLAIFIVHACSDCCSYFRTTRSSTRRLTIHSDDPPCVDIEGNRVSVFPDEPRGKVPVNCSALDDADHPVVLVDTRRPAQVRLKRLALPAACTDISRLRFYVTQQFLFPVGPDLSEGSDREEDGGTRQSTFMHVDDFNYVYIRTTEDVKMEPATDEPDPLKTHDEPIVNVNGTPVVRIRLRAASRSRMTTPATSGDLTQD